MRDMAVQIHADEIANARKSLPARVANLRKSNSGVKSAGTLVEEKVSGAPRKAMPAA